jgi:hypothetical protein
VKILTKSDETPFTDDVQEPAVPTEKKVEGLEAICCIAEQAEIGEAVSVLQLEGVAPVGAP